MDVAQPVGDGHRVEGVIRKRQVHRVADDLGHVAVLAGGEHALGKVAGNHPRAGLAQLHGGHGGAGGEIQHELAGLQVQALAGAAAPVLVQAERQHSVCFVVIFAHVVEHAGNVEGLFVQIRLGHGAQVYFATHKRRPYDNTTLASSACRTLLFAGMGLDDSNMGAWLEAIALFETAREGDYLASARLVRSSANPEDVTLNLMRLLAVYLRDESPEKLDRFIATSHRVGPPPLL